MRSFHLITAVSRRCTRWALVGTVSLTALQGCDRDPKPVNEMRIDGVVRTDPELLAKFIKLPWTPLQLHWQTETDADKNWSLTVLMELSPAAIEELVTSSKKLPGEVLVPHKHLEEWFPEAVRKRYAAAVGDHPRPGTRSLSGCMSLSLCLGRSSQPWPPRLHCYRKHALSSMPPARLRSRQGEASGFATLVSRSKSLKPSTLHPWQMQTTSREHARRRTDMCPGYDGGVPVASVNLATAQRNVATKTACLLTV